VSQSFSPLIELMSKKHTFINYETACSRLREVITQSLEIDGSANILVSGGVTPMDILDDISRMDIAHKHVAYFLTDERLVDPSNRAFENHPLLKSVISRNSLLMLPEDLTSEKRIKVGIFGFGHDGHIGSIFENGKYTPVGNLLLQTTEAIGVPMCHRRSVTMRVFLSVPVVFIGLSDFTKLNVIFENKGVLSCFLRNYTGQVYFFQCMKRGLI
jgi:6-phosphogluconolactonase/glucosamine-6-phosphate isomerase/deaminase